MHNPERGEVPIEIGGEKGVICAENGRLAALCGAVGSKSLTEIMQRVMGADPATMFHALDCMVTSGNAKALRDALNRGKPSDFTIVGNAVARSLEAFQSKNG